MAALRNGTIGWTLAGQQLDHGASRRAPATVGVDNRDSARRGARAIADRAGVRRIALAALPSLQEPGRTVYRFDVRTPGEFAGGHLPGFVNAPGGQLVQETDHNAPVRGARIVLADDDDVRASMTGSWLAQMGWEIWVVEPADASARGETGAVAANVPMPPAVPTVAPAELATWLDKNADGGTAVLDFTASANYVKRHIPGAYFVIRAQLADALPRIPQARRYVLTCGSSLLARFAAADLQRLTDAEVVVLEGGTQAWIAAGLPLESGETHLASARTDRYRRPYEGTDNPREAMQGYLDWEFGLIAQLERDGTHGFRVA
ncbi:Rhodanese-like domain protein [compost metagenome]